MIVFLFTCGALQLIRHIFQGWCNKLSSNPNKLVLPTGVLSKLPEDIIILILTKLPAKALVHLRCVSKFFDLIISQHYFLDLHLSCIQDQIMQHDHDELYSIGYNSNGNEYYLCRHDVDSGRILSASSLYCELPSTVISNVHVVGSTRGLVCLFNWDSSCESFSLTLSNPASRKSKKLPLLPDFRNIRTDVMDCYNIIFGFAFDHETVDFKLAVILYDKPPKQQHSWKTGRYPAKFFVYAEKRKSWSNVTRIVLPCYIVATDGLFFKRSVSVNGVAYWLARKEGAELEQENDCIMGFDVVTEAFEVVELPQHILMQLGNLRSTYAGSLRLFSLVDEKSLALFVSMEGVRGYVHSKNWSLWVMNAGSNSNQKYYWEKRYNLVLDYLFFPLGMVNDRQLLADVLDSDASADVWDARNHGLVDVEKKSFKELQACGLPIFNRIIGYVPSLALLDA